MTDRELLELAAKAAGIDIDIEAGDPETGVFIRDEGFIAIWTPLADDGDALRLAVKLHLDVQHNSPLDNDYYVFASRCGIEMCRDPITVGEDFEGEIGRPQAIRRAIVRAAAEIGKAMS